MRSERLGLGAPAHVHPPLQISVHVLVRDGPVGAGLHIGNKRYLELDHVIHHIGDKRSHGIGLLKRALEVKLVVHLQNHVRM